MAIKVTDVNESPEAGGLKNEETKTPQTNALVDNDKLANALEMLAKSLAAQNKGNKVEDQEKMLTAIISEINKKSDIEKFGDGSTFIAVEDIDPKDYIEDGVAFYCHQGGYVINSDMRQRKQVRTPYGNTIIFEFQHSSVKGFGKDVKIEPLSQYVSFSKKEVKWLEESSFFGWKIFNDFNKPHSQSALEAVKLAGYYMATQNMEMGELMNACRTKGIPISKERSEMRLALASIYAKEEMKLEGESNKMRAINAIKEQDLLPSI